MTNSELIKKVQSTYLKEEMPEFKTGMEVEVHQIIKEGGKERIQKYRGIIIKVSGKSLLERTITVRKKVGAFGIEKVFPIHSPSVGKIEILRNFKVRRKFIGYVRTAVGKNAKLKEINK